MRRSFSIITIGLFLFFQFAITAARSVQAGAEIGSSLAERAVAHVYDYGKGVAQQVASPTPEIIMAVVTVTPMPDGSMVHEVLPGQSLWAIAIAYGVKIADLVNLNKQLSPTNPVIFVGQKIMVRGTSLPTPSPTVSNTPVPVSRTPRVTKTPRPPTRNPAATRTYTPTVKEMTLPDLRRSKRPTVVCWGLTW